MLVSLFSSKKSWLNFTPHPMGRMEEWNVTKPPTTEVTPSAVDTPVMAHFSIHANHSPQNKQSTKEFTASFDKALLPELLSRACRQLFHMVTSASHWDLCPLSSFPGIPDKTGSSVALGYATL